MIEEQAKTSGEFTCFVAIDVIKAYDRADQNRSITKIQKIAPAEAHITNFLWTNAVTYINYEGSTICGYCTNYGLRQGAPSSPTIFNLIMKDVMKRLMYYGHGVTIGPFRIPGAAFADDSWLVADNWERAEAAYYAMRDGLAHFGLEANPKKSYCWRIPVYPLEEFGNFGDIFPIRPRIPYSKDYNYLGLNYKLALRKEILWENALSKARRLEATVIRA